MAASLTPQRELDRIAAECALFTSRRLARVVTLLYDRALKPSGLRGTQFNVLVAVARLPRTSLSVLAGLLGMDRTNLTAALRSLQRQGFITEVKGPDRRARYLMLSDAGERQVAASASLWRGIQVTLESTLGAGEWRDLSRRLRRASRQVAALARGRERPLNSRSWRTPERFEN